MENEEAVNKNVEQPTTTESAPVENKETTEETVETQETQETTEKTEVVDDKYENVKKALAQERAEKKKLSDYIKQLNKTNEEIKPDENGFIDPNKYKEQIKNEMRQELEWQASERQDWEKAVSEHPELSKDEDLIMAIKGMRQAALLNGQLLSSTEAAKKLFSKIDKASSKAEEEGIKKAQVSERIVDRAQMVEPTSSKHDNSEVDDLKEKMSYADHRVSDQARLEYLSKFGDKYIR
ncbi:MAG: hypothetical protein BWY74_00351 [Firmicutes bacterium ADurb.Bin419]|nr:MAG: hypothetical protein BWY74_00351 [Firmicutes bacterium ADurb.Bin419]